MTTPTPTPTNDRDQTLPLPGGQPADALGTGKINAQQPIVAADPLQMATVLDNLLFNKVDAVDKSLVTVEDDWKSWLHAQKKKDDPIFFVDSSFPSYETANTTNHFLPIVMRTKSGTIRYLLFTTRQRPSPWGLQPNQMARVWRRDVSRRL